MLDLEKKIEAILFYKAESVTVKWLSRNLKVQEGDVWQSITSLEETLKDRGVRIVRKDDSVSLATASEAGTLIEEISKEELTKELGKAALETLTIVLYKNPVAKSEIDYIRGVNSGFILRNLLIRGLIERMQSPEDKRLFLYRPTVDLFSHLGITKQEALPEFDMVEKEIKQFKDSFGKEDYPKQ